MAEITIATQVEFDALPDSFPEFIIIEIKSDPTIAIVVNRRWSNAVVVAYNNSTVVACDKSTVEAWGNSTVWARDKSTVEAFDKSTVEARGESTVDAYDNSKVEAFDNSSVEAWCNSSVKYAGCLADFSSWFLLNKDNLGIVEAMKKQFVDQPEYMQKINMILLFS